MRSGVFRNSVYRIYIYIYTTSIECLCEKNENMKKKDKNKMLYLSLIRFGTSCVKFIWCVVRFDKNKMYMRKDKTIFVRRKWLRFPVDQYDYNQLYSVQKGRTPVFWFPKTKTSTYPSRGSNTYTTHRTLVQTTRRSILLFS